MGRQPYCERAVGIKKGPWTPEEDIILVSYIQQHGPGNWRSVPANTGLLRCSKSCRLRWTNYLRPGIKRGNFTEQEEKTIIHLQALLGNRWAAIATYLPERTDNDIKNFWNTHLRKKLSKTDTDNDDTIIISQNRTQKQNTVKDRWEKRLQTDINLAKQALSDALSLRRTLSNPNSNDSSFPGSYATATYASSTENISRLLKSWTKPKSPLSDQQQANSETDTQNSFNNNKDSNLNQPIFRFYSANSESGSMADTIGPETRVLQEESKTKGSLSLIEKWLFDDQGTTRSDDQDDFSNMSLENHDVIF